MSKLKRLLIRHVDVLEPGHPHAVLKSCDIAIEGNKISEIGKVPDGFLADETIDASNHIAMPGFFNTHCHATMSLMRGWAEDLPLNRWFNERMWPAESALTEEDIYWGSSLTICEMIKSGTVGFADHYFWMHQVAKAVQESGMKALLSWCQFGSDKFPEKGNVSQNQITEFVREFNGSADGRIKTILGPHSPYIGTRASLERAALLAQELGVGCHIHVAEEKHQLENSLQKYNMTPVAFLESVGIFENPSIAAHVIHIHDSDLEILARKRVSVSSCPKTNLRLALGMTRIPEMLEAGVNVTLGTDGGHNNYDMIETMRLAVLISKHMKEDPTLLPSIDALHLATQAGAKAMGFSESGQLRVGADADLILMNTNAAHMVPRHNLAANVVHSALSSDVSYVIVDGRVILNKKQLCTMDEEKIMAECQSRASRLVSTGTPTSSVHKY